EDTAMTTTTDQKPTRTWMKRLVLAAASTTLAVGSLPLPAGVASASAIASSSAMAHQAAAPATEMTASWGQSDYYRGYRDGYRTGFWDGRSACHPIVQPYGRSSSWNDYERGRTDGYQNGYQTGFQFAV